MKQADFLKRLARLRRLGWRINRRGKIRSSNDCCPITAVRGKGFGLHRVTRASQALGLSDRVGRRIVLAADHPYTYPRVRRKLLTALALTERSSP